MTAEVLKGGLTSYKPLTEVETPYIKGMREWDNRIGTSAAQARNWRVACLVTTLSTLALSVGMVVISSQRKVYPVVILANDTTGEAKALGKIEAQYTKPSSTHIKYFIGQFITKYRSMPLDAVVFRKNWEDAYRFLTTDASQKLNQLPETDEKIKRVGHDSITVQLVSINRIADSDSYQARWTETLYKDKGFGKDVYNMTGVFSIHIEEPATEEQIMRNPLGVYIKELSMSRDLKN